MSTLIDRITEARNTLSADRLDMSFGELMNMYTNDELIIDPEFQRYFRWTIYQRTRFLESVLLGIPVPSMFMAEDASGKWEVVDGLQRICTILSFYGVLRDDRRGDNNWKLETGDIVTELDGLALADLPVKYQLNIKRVPVRVEVIKWDSKYDMRYELFNRLNTGGSPLTDQEIRNCIFRTANSALPDVIKRLSNTSIFVKLIKPTAKQETELYLDELVLRFFSLYRDREPKKNLSEHMTDYMRDASSNPEFYSGYAEIFEKTVELLAPLGNDIFRAGNNQFASSRYDGIMIGVARNIEYYEANQGEINGKIHQLVEDDTFKAATGVSSNYKQRVRARTQRGVEIFSEH